MKVVTGSMFQKEIEQPSQIVPEEVGEEEGVTDGGCTALIGNHWNVSGSGDVGSYLAVQTVGRTHNSCYRLAVQDLMGMAVCYVGLRGSFGHHLTDFGGPRLMVLWPA